MSASDLSLGLWNVASERVSILMWDGNVSLSARECDITELLRASNRARKESAASRCSKTLKRLA